MACHRVAAVFVIWLLIPCGLPQDSSLISHKGRFGILYDGTGVSKVLRSKISRRVRRNRSVYSVLFDPMGKGASKEQPQSSDLFIIKDLILSILFKILNLQLKLQNPISSYSVSSTIAF